MTKEEGVALTVIQADGVASLIEDREERLAFYRGAGRRLFEAARELSESERPSAAGSGLPMARIESVKRSTDDDR